MSKYDALAAFLAEVPADQTEVHLSFEEVDRLIGGLPDSAREHRPWWGNSSSVQGSAWTRAGWHVGKVELGLSRVTFVRGSTRVTRPGRGLGALMGSPTPAAPEEQTVETVSVGVTFTYQRLGLAFLEAGKFTIPGSAPVEPGLYRFTTLRDGTAVDVYVGEADELVTALLAESLSEGLEVAVDVVTEASLKVRGEPAVTLDLGRESSRLLVESAAVVLSRAEEESGLAGLP